MPGGYFLAGRTSQNPVKRKINFREGPKGEVRRIYIPRTPVNKGKKVAGPSTTGFVRTTYLGIG
jgi:hypothetical protein